MKKIRNNLGEFFCVIGVATITSLLVMELGFIKGVLFGVGLAMIAGGIIRVIKSEK